MIVVTREAIGPGSRVLGDIAIAGCIWELGLLSADADMLPVTDPGRGYVEIQLGLVVPLGRARSIGRDITIVRVVGNRCRLKAMQSEWI